MKTKLNKLSVQKLKAEGLEAIALEDLDLVCGGICSHVLSGIIRKKIRIDGEDGGLESLGIPVDIG